MFKAILSNTFATGIVCFLLLAALWTPDLFLHPAAESDRLWYSLLFTIASAILLFVINRLHLFAGDNENVMILYYTLLSSAMPASLCFSGAQPATLCILAGIYILFHTYQSKNILSAIFFSTLLISIASLFYLPAIGTAIAIALSIIVSRSFNWRDWTAFLGGLLLPYFYLWLYYFFFSSSLAFWEIISANIPTLYFPHIALTFYDYLYLSALSLLVIWSLLTINTTGALNKIKASHMRQTFIFLLFSLLLAAMFFHPQHNSIMTLTAIPLSVILANASKQICKKKIYIFLLLIIFTAIIGSRIL